MDISILYEKFGRYQLVIFIYGCIACAYAPLPVYLHLFVSENYNYRCFVPGCDNDNSAYKESWLNFSIPSGGSHDYEKCERFVSLKSTNSCLATSFDINHKEKCSEYVFEASYTSLARKFNLLCGKQWIWDSAESVFMAGVIISAALVGFICDRYGRKKALIVYSIAIFIVCLSNSFAPNFYFFIVFSFLSGGFSQVGPPMYTLCLETTGTKYRSAVGVGLGIAYAVGELFLALFAYFYPQWQSISFFVAFTAIGIILVSYLMPESIVWLSSQNKKEDLHAEVSKLVRWNNLTMPDLENEVSNNEDAPLKPKKEDFGNPLILFKTPYLRKCTIAQMVIWFCVSFVYFGASLGSKHLGSNYLMTFVFLALSEIPSNALAGFALMKFGRKSIQIVILTVCGIAFLISAFLSDDYLTVKTGLAVLGKACVAAQWSINIIYTVELFPTVVRSVGYSNASMCARISAIIAAYVPELAHLNKSLPMITFSICGFIPAIALCILPETVDRKTMFDTIEEAEESNKSSKGFFGSFSLFQTKQGSQML